jgi:hypothetical protein
MNFIGIGKSLQGETWGGIPIYAPEDIRKESLIIVTGGYADIQIRNQLVNMGYIERYNFITSFTYDAICRNFVFSQIRKFQDIHRGERCFIIGNGPSLTVNDIETIGKSGDVVLVSNNFHKMFDRTAFRPKYYFLDDAVGNENIERVFSCPGITIFADFYYRNHNVNLDNTYFFEQSSRMYYNTFPYDPMFSDDMALPFAAGTIYYTMLQSAVNMGFTDIYLLGISHEVPLQVTYDGTVIADNNQQYYFYPEKGHPAATHTKEMTEAAYSYALDYCEKKGVRIHNATRGGKLEIFGRVDFDGLF